MNAATRREIAMRAVRAQLRALGIDPATATAYDIEAVISDMPADTVAGAFYRDASDNQWRLFLREFRAWQRREARRRVDDAATATTTLVYGIRKDTSNYALLAVSGPNDTRAGHDHLRAIVPVPCTVHDAKAALDAAYDAGTGLECRREDGVFVVEFFRPLVMEPPAAKAGPNARPWVIGDRCFAGEWVREQAA